MTTLDEFEALQTAKATAYEGANAAYAEVRRDCDIDMRKRWKSETSRRWAEKQVSSQPWYDDFMRPWREKGETLRAAWEEKAGNFEREFERIGREIELAETDEEILAHRTCGLSWSTQGYGANKYAEGSARSMANTLSFNGIEAEVRIIDREESRSRYGSDTWLTYGVFARLDPRAVALLPYLPRPDLRDEVKAMWKGGVNPRVFMPFLPHGYEESVGIDFLGNDLDEARQPAAARP